MALEAGAGRVAYPATLPAREPDDDLERAFPDCRVVRPEGGAVLDALFGRQPSRVWLTF